MTAIEDRLFETYLNRIAPGAAGESSVPLQVEAMPKFLQDYLELTAYYTDAVPGALLTAFLPIVAVNIGNKVWIRGSGKQQYCHIWAILVGPSTTSRKSTCIRLAAHTLTRYQDRIRTMEPEEYEKKQLSINSTTNSKMVSLLAQNPNRLFEFHEIAVLLKNSGLKYNAGMKENLTSFYDGDSKTYANQDRTEYIDRPALSILGASTEGWIYNGFETAAEQGSGFLQRFIYCVIGPREEGFNSDPEFTPPSYDSLHQYDDIFEVFRSLPENYELKMELPQRKEWLAEHDRVLNEILYQNDEVLLEYAGRIYNNVFCSLAIIISMMKEHEGLRKAIAKGRCAEFFEALRVSSETVSEALYLCGFYLQNAIPMINIIKEGGAWHDERRIMKHLAGRPDHEDSHSNIMNTLHIKARDLQECVRNLMEQDFLEAFDKRSGSGGKAAKIYRLRPGLAES